MVALSRLPAEGGPICGTHETGRGWQVYFTLISDEQDRDIHSATVVEGGVEEVGRHLQSMSMKEYRKPLQVSKHCLSCLSMLAP